MKKGIIIIGVLIITSCSNPCKEDVVFKKLYFKILHTIDSYGKQFDTDEDVFFKGCDTFYYYTSYLEFLTNHEFRYIVAESNPIYLNQSDLKADIKDLEKWYKENKCIMTMEKADSIVNKHYQEKIGKSKNVREIYQIH